MSVYNNASTGDIKNKPPREDHIYFNNHKMRLFWIVGAVIATALAQVDYDERGANKGAESCMGKSLQNLLKKFIIDYILLT